MKKYLLLAFSFALVFTMTACGGGNKVTCSRDLEEEGRDKHQCEKDQSRYAFPFHIGFQQFDHRVQHQHCHNDAQARESVDIMRVFYYARKYEDFL